MTSQLLRRKPVSAEPESGLARSIGTFGLMALGIGATIGTGIFFVLSTAVPEAGPAVTVGFVLAAVTAGFTALCYAELASAIPASGSSYSYAYATLGELVAYVVGWCLVLEYAVSSAAVSVGWSEYLDQLLRDTLGVTIPDALAAAPGAGGVVNLPALVLVALCALLLVRGASESTTVNAVMVVVKVGVLLLFVVLALTGFDSGNLTPFAPLGVAGISAAASSIFFSFIGLDAVSTAGEEVRDPRRTLPRAVLGALAVVTVVYLLVAFAAVGAQPAGDFEGQTAGLAVILERVTGATWPAVVLAAGAVVSIFSVTLVTMYGQTRILYAMSRDGMVPRVFSRLHPRTRVPVRGTLLVALFVGALAGFLPLDFLVDLTSMGTLVAFAVVSVGVLVLRRTDPDLPRGFRVPGYPVVPVLSVLFCLYLVAGLSATTFLLFAGWLALAGLVYVGYARRHSTLRDTPSGG
ncbi:amino acid permease [Klenkia taihuensis]|uniref:Basic amino acid/polyamine antiporter, APA family n=1 Tax=Klenkia taihuensis TaxID=1225127 RepID=A0A1I1NM92_9ACTN|nr:amino acid permease [Klenkia taihuensis]GHE11863.1 putative cationic amino acid transport integral membrane protein [Klenkia taihuensis]SFC98546.1 basic amino acid/polyamine antiporter, APA family [Klenkia taihuensis]